MSPLSLLGKLFVTAPLPWVPFILTHVNSSGGRVPRGSLGQLDSQVVVFGYETLDI